MNYIIYLLSFKLLLCWLRSLTAALQLEIYWVCMIEDSGIDVIFTQLHLKE
ncbi:hypothetical protein [Photorhabdus heterorhabditis]|uniref:hypothetical protein n=1 Tax=Photorhabdus heterorhabditis TaxID=880156 RepID=UPI0020B813CB|nr:hypothetical protein [Photorhabdus heterorhabditis]